MYRKIDISISNLYNSKAKINHFNREIYVTVISLPEKFLTFCVSINIFFLNDNYYCDLQ